MKQTGALGETSADGVQAEPALRPLQRMLSRRVARSPLAETWRTRAGAGAALVTAALLMSACADASSTTGDAASAPSRQTSAAANAVSNNDSLLTAKSQPDAPGPTANATNGVATASTGTAVASAEIGRAHV